MLTLRDDRRVVLTVDAGGTSFRFNAVQGGRAVLEPLRMPTLGDDLDRCLGQLLDGFEAVHQSTGRSAVALSFAFPGPADYAHGIIGDLPNLPAFRGGVALGPLLEERFGLPVFINNDGALFAYGEALGGLLPWVNGQLAAAGAPRRFGTLIGFTLGTGLGGGLVVDGRLLRGDNSAAAQVWTLRHPEQRGVFVEEGASIRAVRRVYAERAGLAPEHAPEPKVIAAIADGSADGDRDAAREAWRAMGAVAGDAIATAVAVMDGLVVLGGGLSAAAPHLLPALLEAMRGRLRWLDGREEPRLLARPYDLEDSRERAAFFQGEVRRIPVGPGGRTVPYDPLRRTGVGLSRLGTSEAMALGAYAFALEQLARID
ncbi:MAG: ROK family protein [Anaeromyxobacter sp.]